jgi:glycosyltransferase involved in cell wall biosynthesis
MKNIPCDFTSNTKILQYKDNLERMKSCDVYIELLNPQINGDKYGSFGTTAVEAAMLGKIVVTQNLSSDVYAATYGQSPLVLVKDEQDFVEKINWLLSLTPEEIFELKKEHQKWSITKHSYLATGKRLKKILDEI